MGALYAGETSKRSLTGSFLIAASCNAVIFFFLLLIFLFIGTNTYYTCTFVPHAYFDAPGDSESGLLDKLVLDEENSIAWSG